MATDAQIQFLRSLDFRMVDSGETWMVHAEYTAMTVGIVGPLRWQWLGRGLPINPQSAYSIPVLMARVPALWSTLVKAAYGDEPTMGFGDGGWREFPAEVANG